MPYVIAAIVLAALAFIAYRKWWLRRDRSLRIQIAQEEASRAFDRAIAEAKERAAEGDAKLQDLYRDKPSTNGLANRLRRYNQERKD